ncbi:HIT family protein [Patescibacteria group bacterium]|nr:HIT family protein [Patescibacteria group bacterium]
MDACVLCNALINETYRVVYQDESVFAIINDSPVKKGHVMILPVRHVENLSDLKPIESQAFLSLSDRCMRAVEKLTGETSLAIVNGWGFRSQNHLHLHVVPSKHSLRRLFVAAEGVEHRVPASIAELEGTASELTKSLMDST